MKKVSDGLIVNYSEIAEMVKKKLKEYNKEDFECLFAWACEYIKFKDEKTIYNDEDIEKLFISPIFEGVDIDVTPRLEKKYVEDEYDVDKTLWLEVKVNNHSFSIPEYKLLLVLDDYDEVFVDHYRCIVILVNAKDE